MKDRKKIDELFSKGFGGYEAKPPADVWSHIEHRLESHKRRKRIGYWRWAGTAAAVVLAFFTGYFFPDQQGSNTNWETPAPAERSLKETKQAIENEHIASEETAEEVPAFPGNKGTGQKNSVGKTKSSGFSGPANLHTEDLGPHELATAPSSEVTQEKKNSERLQLKAKNIITFTGIQNDEKAVPAGEQILDPAVFNAETIASLPGDEEKSIVLSQQPVIQDHTNLLTNDELKTKSDFKTSGLSLGLLASPTFAFRNVNIQETNDAFLAENVSNENLVNSYTAGVDVSYRQSSRFEFQAGIYLNNWAQYNDRVILSRGTGSSFTSSDPQEVYGNTSVSNVKLETSSGATDLAGFPTPDSSQSHALLVPAIEQQYHFIEIPLSVGFYILESKSWGLKIRGGLSPRISAGSRVSLAYADGTEIPLSNDGLRPFSLQLMAGTGVEYRVSRHLRIHLLPSLQYGLTSVNQHKEVSTYFHQALIYSGLSYKF